MHQVMIDLLRVSLAPAVFFLFGFGVLPIFKCPAKNRRFVDRHGKFLVAAGVMTAIVACAVVFQH